MSTVLVVILLIVAVAVIALLLPAASRAAQRSVTQRRAETGAMAYEHAERAHEAHPDG